MKAPHSEVGIDIREWLEDMAFNAPPGHIIEVGVYKGGTAWHLARAARARGSRLFLCDTFTGIPYQDEAAGDTHRVGDFSNTSLGEVRQAIPDAHYIVGTFPESAGTELDGVEIAFAHLDCDQYQSIKDAVKFLGPKMVQGGIMVFDDYGCLMGANNAVHELFAPDMLRLGVGYGPKAHVIF